MISDTFGKMVTFDNNPFQPLSGSILPAFEAIFSMNLALQGKVKHHHAEPELICDIYIYIYNYIYISFTSYTFHL